MVFGPGGMLGFSPNTTVYVTLDGVTVSTGSLSQITSVTGNAADSVDAGEVSVTLPL